ncbi:hypothetical protein H0A73_14180 [Alcaligenaceae bacterium]|nr:hypothetical protein [Alcaligenaceae bacterium]
MRAHLFLCMLAYYVEWHLKEAWREITFADTEQGGKASRDPVAPAVRSESAKTKAASKRLPDGTLRNTCVYSIIAAAWPAVRILRVSCNGTKTDAAGNRPDSRKYTFKDWVSWCVRGEFLVNSEKHCHLRQSKVMQKEGLQLRQHLLEWFCAFGPP